MNIRIDELTALAAPPADTATVWVPSERISVHRVSRPTAPKRKWPALIPWMLEDAVLGQVENLHFVIAGENGDGTLSVLCAARSEMDEWCRRVESAGLVDYALVPDCFALPHREGCITVAGRDGLLLVRSGAFDGFAAEPELAWLVVERMLQEREEAQRLSVGSGEDAVPPSLQQAVADRDASPDWDGAVVSPGLNLLVGEYRPATSPAMLSRWLPTAALLVVAIIGTYAWLWSDTRRLDGEVAALERDTARAQTMLFPELRSDGSAIRESVEGLIARRFRQRESLEAPLISLLTALDGVIAGCDCRVESLDFSVSGGTMVVTAGGEDLFAAGRREIAGYTAEPQAPEDGRVRIEFMREARP